MSKLFTPLRIRSVTFPNRIVVSPMCQYSGNDGFANDWHLVHLGSRAVGGAGLVFTEAVAVSPEGRLSVHDLGLWREEHVEFLSRIAKFITQQGSVPGIQLAHSGRKGSTTEPWNADRALTDEEGGWTTVGPSPVAFSPDRGIPVELTQEAINELVAAFGDAAERALRAGFRVLEIHAAHGYLIHEFLSPLSNHRTDAYGGPFEHRIRLLLEIITAVRSVWPLSYPLFLRISASDWVDGGWTVEDSIALAHVVKDLDVDLVDCSSGGIVPGVRIPAKPGYQVPFAAAVRQSGMLTGAVGIIVSAEQAEVILEKGAADMIFMARELLRQPYFPLHAAKALGNTDMEWPVQYERAKR